LNKSKNKLILLLFVILSQYAFSQVYTKQNITVQDSAQIKKYSENYNIFLSSNNLRNASDFLNKIAVIYWKRNHFKKSTEYYLKSLELNKKLGNENGIAGINMNLGSIYFDMESYQKSTDCIIQAIATRRKEKNTRTGRENLFNALSNVASPLKKLKKYDDAIKYLKEALSYAKEINNLDKMSIFYLQLAEVYELAGNKKQSKKYMDEYMTFYKQKKNNELLESRMATENQKLRAEKINIAKKLKELELQKKTVELEEKVKEVKKYHSKTDSLTNTLSKEQLAKKVIEQQAKEERLNQQKNLMLLGSIILIVFIIAILLLIGFYQKKVANKKLEDKNAIINKANKDLEDKNYEILQHQNQIIAQKDILDKNNKELNRKNNQIMESIKYAKLIQTAMLGGETVLNQYFPDAFILFKPKDIVSGDFYWYAKVESKIIVATIDCTGHGVPGAFMSLIGANLLNQIVLNNKITNPKQILEELHNGINTSLNQEKTGNDDGMDASITVFDEKEKTLDFSGAQNSIIIIKNGELTEIEADDISVGGTHRDENEKFTNKTIKLTGDNHIYSFSDGYPDQFGGKKDKKFMLKRLKNILLEIHQKNMKEQKEILETTIDGWKDKKNTKQTDDILVIGVRIKI